MVLASNYRDVAMKLHLLGVKTNRRDRYKLSRIGRNQEKKIVSPFKDGDENRSEWQLVLTDTNCRSQLRNPVKQIFNDTVDIHRVPMC